MARKPNRQKVKTTKAGPKAKARRSRGRARSRDRGRGRGRWACKAVEHPSRPTHPAEGDERRGAARQCTDDPLCDPRVSTEDYDLGVRAEARGIRAILPTKQYCDGATVTEEKLLLFLVEEVAGRPFHSYEEWPICSSLNAFLGRP
ncbi:hypothetical protein HIM_09761 [Hirsutella minnesotensis 3608]|uniref:Uncharacterized protein n=1 Tax=Hirsutella minnesotensis 3608 TaxID=1043627 RepID=A0A0F7ZXJ8_9HYPO|nr:hypothetical protein HIM_09761 [Hirsutella minnesotensis 3608]